MITVLRRYYSKVSACVIGSGPAGFYCAQHLLKILPSSTVDIYEKLPVPFGLVRYGVAPDHPEVKNVINTFNKVASDPRFQFIGNVKLGSDISLRQLTEAYHVVILAYGAEDDARLGVPGEEIRNVISARQFVGWYNGLPENRSLQVNLNANIVSIFGHGNVAIDVARILLKSVDELRSTDISDYSLNSLSESKVRHVCVIGRRGPLQASFTTKEFREMTKLRNVKIDIKQDQLTGIEQCLKGLPRPRKRLTELLLQSATTNKIIKYDKTLEFRFLQSPKEFVGQNTLKGVNLRINTLQGNDPESQSATPTDTEIYLPCELAMRSIGYRSIKVDADIPFDEQRRCVGNLQQPGLYATGWLAHGSVGVILTTMANAFETAAKIANDISNNRINVGIRKHGYSHVNDILVQKGVQTVSWQGWKKIDEIEVKRGKCVGKPREKITDIGEMLKVV